MKQTKQRSGVLAGIDKGIEQMLEQYLKARGWTYRWQQQVNRKLPEAIILQNGKPVAVIEATFLPSIEPDSQKPAEVAFAEEAKDKIFHASELTKENLSYALQERLQRKQGQATAAAQQNLPFLLAMWGKVLKGVPQYVLELLKNYPEVSALGMLHRDSALMIAYRMRKASLTPDAKCLLGLIEELLQRRWRVKLEQILEAPSRVPDVELSWMEILHNPFATHPWRDDLRGVYDHVYVWSEKEKQWLAQYDGTSAVLRTLATRLLAGIVNAPFTDDVVTSRSENFYEEREPTLHTA